MSHSVQENFGEILHFINLPGYRNEIFAFCSLPRDFRGMRMGLRQQKKGMVSQLYAISTLDRAL